MQLNSIGIQASLNIKIHSQVVVLQSGSYMQYIMYLDNTNIFDSKINELKWQYTCTNKYTYIFNLQIFEISGRENNL